MAADGREAGAGDTYRPHLDGLRAVAVYLVVVFHAGSGGFAGGFIGVDVFFVLSGFLVTRLLLRDLVPSGSLRFRRFYARRFRRLLPAAFAVLVVTALVFQAVASPIEQADAVGGFKAAFLYVANWYFIAESSQYFGSDVDSNPVVHFWSLAVEEQFYLLWPLLLAGLFALARRFRGRERVVLRLVVAAGAVASLVWALSLRDSDPNRAYYGTDARAYQLLAGAVVALSPELFARRPRLRGVGRLVSVAGVAGVLLVATTWTDVDPIERGAIVTVLTMAVIVALEVADGGVMRRVLSAEPVVYLGKVSYATYLWHWPVILVLARSFDISTGSTIFFAVLVATALASLSFQLLEHPIRVSALLDRHRTPVIASGLAVSVLSALVLIPAIFDEGPSAPAAAATDQAPESVGFTPVPDLDFAAVKKDVPAIENCYGEEAAACTKVQGSGPHVLIVGDSHAAMIVPGFELLARRADLTLSVATGPACPWQQGLNIPGAPYVPPETCNAERADVYERVIPELDPDVVVVMNRSYETDDNGPHYGVGDDRITPASPELHQLLDETTRRSLDQLKADGRKVVLIEPTPFTSDFSPIHCLADAEFVEDCRSIFQPNPTYLERLYRELDADEDQVWSLDLDRLVCPYLPICDPIIDGMVARLDGSHLTKTYVRSLAPALLEVLEENGILQPA